jgi:hypothetical protein
LLWLRRCILAAAEIQAFLQHVPLLVNLFLLLLLLLRKGFLLLNQQRKGFLLLNQQRMLLHSSSRYDEHTFGMRSPRRLGGEV